MQFGFPFLKEKLANLAKKRQRQSQVQNSFHAGEPRWKSFLQPGKGQARENMRDVYKIINGMENQQGDERSLPLGQIHGGEFSQIQRHHHCFKESLTQNLLESLLETCPFMPVLILTLSIYYLILLLLIFTYRSKIPFSTSTPNKCGGESSRDNEKEKETQQCKNREDLEALTSLLQECPPSPRAPRELAGTALSCSTEDEKKVSALGTSHVRHPPPSTADSQQGQEGINEEVPRPNGSETGRTSMNPAEERILVSDSPLA